MPSTLGRSARSASAGALLALLAVAAAGCLDPGPEPGKPGLPGTSSWSIGRGAVVTVAGTVDPHGLAATNCLELSSARDFEVRGGGVNLTWQAGRTGLQSVHLALRTADGTVLAETTGPLPLQLPIPGGFTFDAPAGLVGNATAKVLELVATARPSSTPTLAESADLRLLLKGGGAIPDVAPGVC